MLDKNSLKSDIKKAYNANASQEDSDKAVEKLATDISNAVEKYVKSALVKVNVIGITTAGSASAQTQVGTKVCTGYLT